MGNTPKPGDPDQHRAVSKNGKDAIQDRELRDLKDHVKRWEAEEVRVHGAIEGGLRDIRDDLKGVSGLAHTNSAAVARIEGRQSSNRMWWGLFGALLIALLGGIWWGLEQGADAVREGFNKQETALERATEAAFDANSKIDSWIKEATRWGNRIDATDARQQKELDRNEARIERCCQGQRKDR